MTVVAASAAIVAPVNTAVSMREVTAVGAVRVMVAGVSVKNVFSAVADAPKVAAEPVRVNAPVELSEKSVKLVADPSASL